jgi:hypothetical protein
MRLWERNRFGVIPRPAGWDRPGLSVADKRQLQEVLHQQMWCWGRDVLARPDNLLIRFGMARHEPVDPDQRGSNRYSVTIEGRFDISLWAFGIAAVDGPFGVFLHRYQRGVRILPRDWSAKALRGVKHLPVMRRPASQDDRQRSSQMLNHILRWIEEYERWVLSNFGPDYRCRTLKGWEHPVVQGEEMADEWRRLADAYRRASAQPRLTLPWSVSG